MYKLQTKLYKSFVMTSFSESLKRKNTLEIIYKTSVFWEF